MSITSSVILSTNLTFRGEMSGTELSNGSIVLAGRLASDSSDREFGGVTVWNVGQDGDAALAWDFGRDEWRDLNGRVVVGSSPDDRVFVFADVRRSPYTGTVWYATSSDGGASFSPAAEIPGANDRNNAHHVESMAVDGQGNAHAIVRSSLNMAKFGIFGGNPSSRSDGVYVRVTPSGDADARLLNGPAEGSFVPETADTPLATLATRGSRVWIVWTHSQDEVVRASNGCFLAVESLDGGQTFDLPHCMSSVERYVIHPWSMGIFPDGRPVLAATYHHDFGRQAYLSSVPMFDPVATNGSLLTIFEMHPGGALAPYSDPESPSNDGTLGDVREDEQHLLPVISPVPGFSGTGVVTAIGLGIALFSSKRRHR